MQVQVLGSFAVNSGSDLLTTINSVSVTPISVDDYCALTDNPYQVEQIATGRGTEVFMSGWLTADAVGIEAEFTDGEGLNPYTATFTPHQYVNDNKFVGGRPHPKPHKPA